MLGKTRTLNKIRGKNTGKRSRTAGHICRTERIIGRPAHVYGQLAFLAVRIHLVAEDRQRFIFGAWHSSIPREEMFRRRPAQKLIQQKIGMVDRAVLITHRFLIVEERWRDVENNLNASTVNWDEEDACIAVSPENDVGIEGKNHNALEDHRVQCLRNLLPRMRENDIAKLLAPSNRFGRSDESTTHRFC